MTREEIRNNYQVYMDYVETVLKEADSDKCKRHPFRSRSAHSRRVTQWAARLCEGREDVDKDVLILAAIFHDIGQADDDNEPHQVVGERMFRAYAKEQGFEEEFAEKVAVCIGTHSNKQMLEQPEQLTMEQLLLMEADWLDEEGALGVCWDSMACSYEGKLSFYEALNRTKMYYEKRKHNPMVTERAKKYWQEKIEFVAEYIRQMEFDLTDFTAL